MESTVGGLTATTVGATRLQHPSSLRFLSTSPELFCVFVRCGGFGTAVPPSLVGHEDGHEKDSCHDAESHSETDLIMADQAVRKQRDARAGDDSVDECDHA